MGRRVSGGQVGAKEASGRRHWLKILIEDIDSPVPEIRPIERGTRLAHPDAEPGVHRAFRAVIHHDGNGSPIVAGNRTVQRGEDEVRWFGRANLEESGPVAAPHLPGWESGLQFASGRWWYY